VSLEDDIMSLAGAPLLGLLEPDALRLLAFAAEGRNLKPGDVLFRKGDRSDGGYIVTRGAIALDTRDDGSTTFVAETGALIGRLTLFTRTVRAATAIARKPSSVLRISPTLMRRVLEEFPNAAPILEEALADDLSDLMSRLEAVRRRFNELNERR
jgi:CRP-like cAMP-binding protein